MYPSLWPSPLALDSALAGLDERPHPPQCACPPDRCHIVLRVLGVRLIYECVEPFGKGRVCDLMKGQDPLKRESLESLSQAAFLAGLTCTHHRRREEFLNVVNTKTYLSSRSLLLCPLPWLAPNRLK